MSPPLCLHLQHWISWHFPRKKNHFNRSGSPRIDNVPFHGQSFWELNFIFKYLQRVIQPIVWMIVKMCEHKEEVLLIQFRTRPATKNILYFPHCLCASWYNVLLILALGYLPFLQLFCSVTLIDKCLCLILRDLDISEFK